jgi:hypothetical protein
MRITNQTPAVSSDTLTAQAPEKARKGVPAEPGLKPNAAAPSANLSGAADKALEQFKLRRLSELAPPPGGVPAPNGQAGPKHKDSGSCDHYVAMGALKGGAIGTVAGALEGGIAGIPLGPGEPVAGAAGAIAGAQVGATLGGLVGGAVGYLQNCTDDDSVTATKVAPDPPEVTLVPEPDDPTDPPGPTDPTDPPEPADPTDPPGPEAPENSSVDGPDGGESGGVDGPGDFGGDGVDGGEDFGGGSGCFVAGTPVLLADGTFAPIESIRVNDIVLSRNEKSEVISPRRVVRHWTHRDHPILVLQLDGNARIETTKEHRFAVPGRGFVAAGELVAGDLVVTNGPRTIAISGIESPSSRSTVYNLTVETDHTYFVSAAGVWVHNEKDAVVGGDDPFGKDD